MVVRCSVGGASWPARGCEWRAAGLGASLHEVTVDNADPGASAGSAKIDRQVRLGLGHLVDSDESSGVSVGAGPSGDCHFEVHQTLGGEGGQCLGGDAAVFEGQGDDALEPDTLLVEVGDGFAAAAGVTYQP